MAVTLQIRRGTKSALTSRGALAAGELGFTTDEKLVYVSDGSANYLIGRVSSGSGAPSGNLVAGTLYIDTATAKLYFCNGSAWVEASPTSITINDSGTGNTDLWSAQKIQTQINAAIDGLDWQESIKDKDLTTPPGSNSEGDRYIVAANPTGAWADKSGQIAEYRSGSWVFFPPNEGFCCLAEDEDVEYVYNGSAWVSRTSSSNHNSLSSIQGGTSGEYYHLTNTDYAALVTNRAETVEDIVGAMVSSNTETGLSITYDDTGGKLNASVTYGTDANTACQGNDSRLSNSRTPTAHASSHQNGGSDEIATATAAANAIPKAGVGGTLSDAWLPTLDGGTF